MVAYEMIDNYKVPIAIIKRIAIEKHVDPFLLGAIVIVESAGNPKATHFEKNYRLNSTLIMKAKLNSVQFGHSFNTELTGTRTAWGLMQIIGGTARTILNFRQPFQKLLDPETNLRLGADFLNILKSKYKRETDVISAYNAGQPYRDAKGRYKNQTYVNKVLSAKKDMALWVNIHCCLKSWDGPAR